MVCAELQAVVLAGGRGSRMTEIAGGRPKCLLPIGPYPMIFYPLQMLIKHGFVDVTVVVLESQKYEIQQALDKISLNIKLDFQTIPSDQDFGTADSLKHIQDKIKNDLLVISCDTISNCNLFSLFDVYRNHNASVTALLVKSGLDADVVVPGPKTKYKPERDLIGIHEPTQRLLFLSSTSDYEETLSLSGHLLRNKEQICIHTRLSDAHVYILKKWVIDFLIKNDGFSTAKGELLPYIVKKQLSRPSVINEHDKVTSVVNVNMKVDEIFNCFARSELEAKVDRTTLYTDTPSKLAYNGDLIRCYASKLPSDLFGTRVNTTQNYYAMNQKIFKIWTQLFNENGPLLISPNSTVKSTQMVDCSVGDGTVINEKTSLKNSVLGRNCQIIEKVRITDCVLMNGVVVEERVVLEGCVVCDNVVIKSGSVLKHCLIGSNYVVPVDTKTERLHLTNADGFMEIE